MVAMCEVMFREKMAKKKKKNKKKIQWSTTKRIGL
jgi:hypothetical protein